MARIRAREIEQQILPHFTVTQRQCLKPSALNGEHRGRTFATCGNYACRHALHQRRKAEQLPRRGNIEYHRKVGLRRLHFRVADFAVDEQIKIVGRIVLGKNEMAALELLFLGGRGDFRQHRVGHPAQKRTLFQNIDFLLCVQHHEYPSDAAKASHDDRATTSARLKSSPQHRSTTCR